MATTHEIQFASHDAQRKQQQPRRRCIFALWLLCSLVAFVATTAQAVPNVRLPAPTVEKAFSPAFVAVGGTTQMTITLTNGNSNALTGVTLTDSYPAGMANAPSGVVASNTCSGTLTADPNGPSAVLVGGTIPATNSCKIVLNIVGTAAGAGNTLTNHTGPVTCANAFAGSDATATLSVTNTALLQPPTVTMTPLPGSITVGGIATMMITLNNPNVDSIVGAQFAMNYPTPLHIVNAPGGALLDENLCGGLFNFAHDGEASMSVTEATIPGGSSCVYFLSVIGTTAGDSDLDTGPVLSGNASPGADATATLSVIDGSLSPAPALQKAFSPNSVRVGGTAQMTITFVNNDADNPITGLQLEDLYPHGIANASNALVDNTCAGLVILHAHDDNTSDFHLYDGNIPAAGSCTVTVNVVGTDAGLTPVNIIGNARSGNAQIGGPASASIAVTAGALMGAPTATKAFDPPTVDIGETSQMTITLINANAFDITGAQFTDHYPDGMANAPNAAVVSNGCGGTLTADPDGKSAALVDGTIPATGNCEVVINVIGKSEGQWINQTGSIPSSNALTGANALAGLTVQGGTTLAAPTVSKEFTPQSVAVGDPVQMTITLTNNDPLKAITGVQFTDPYPGGMANASSGVVDSNTCGGTVTAAQNGLSAALANGTVPAGGACEVVVNVVAVGTAQGGLMNHTGPVNSTNAMPGADASATLTVGGGVTPQTVTFTSTAPANAKVAGPTYAATAHATSNLPASLTIDTTSNTVCTINNGTVSFIGVGTCTIDANQGGDLTFAPAPQVQQSFAVAAAVGVTPQTITFTSTAPANAKVGGPVYAATAHATSNLPVTLTIDATSNTVCAINNGVVSFINVGTCTIDANQGGDPTFAPAPQVQQSFAVAAAVGVTPQTITFTSAAPANAKVGGPAYVATAHASSNLPVSLTIDASSDTVCTINNGTVSFINVGTCTIDANQGGDPTFAPAPQVQQSFAVAAATGVTQQTITFTSTAPANAKVGGPAYVATAHATSNLPVTLTIDAASDTTCTINNGTVTFIGVGTCTIDGNQGGDPTFAPAPQVQQSFAVAAAAGVTPQTITFTSTAPANAKVGGSAYAATAHATSNLPVSLSIDASSDTVCTINNGTVSFIGVGTCTVDANQGGDLTFAPAPQVQQSFAVAAAAGVTPQTITFTSTAPTNAKVGGPAYVATAHATSNLPVSLTIDSTSDTVCTINNGTVSFIGVGTCVIDANQGGDSTFAPAPQVQQSFAVVAATGVTPQTITFTSTAPANAKVGGPAYAATAHATSNLSVILTIDSASDTVCTINNGTVSFIGVGTCTIDANQGGDPTFAPAPQVQQSFAVADAAGITPQTITFTSTAPGNAKVAGPTYLVTAQATPSGLPVSMTIDAASDTVCTINNGTVSFIGAGTCTIDANQGGDATYAPASQVQQSFAVASAGGVTPQTISFTSTAPANAKVAGPTYVATAHATPSGLPVVLTIDSTSATVCTINNGTVAFIGAGTCTIDANQGGDSTYASASQVQQSFTVASAGGITQQAITFTSVKPVNAKVAGPVYLATAHATPSNLPVVLTIDAGSATVCTINAGTVTFIGAGPCTIDANQGGDATYAPASQVQQSFTVSSAGGTTPQTIVFTSTAPANAKVAGSTYLATAHATPSGLPVVLTIDGSSNTVCQINAGMVSFIGAGTCTINANQGGNATYAAASQVQQSFAVASAGGVASQTIAFTSTAPANAKVGGPAYVATAHATPSGLPVVLTIDAISIKVCTIDNGTVSFIGTGTCTIDANQGGDPTYAAAAQVQQSFIVAPGGGITAQTIAFTSTAPANANVGGPTYLATAKATPSDLPVVLTIDAVSSGVCKINSGTVSFIGAGTCTIDANQGGDATYAPAVQVQQSFAVSSGAGGGQPIAVGDAIEVVPGATATTLVGDPNTPGSVLDNDMSAVSAELVSGPAHSSTFTFNADGTFAYKDNGTSATDSFTYRAKNAQQVNSNVATVTITIGNGLNNHLPFAVGDAIEVTSGSTTTALVGNPKTFASVLDNDSDPDAGDTLTATKLTDTTHGTLNFAVDGTFSYHNDGPDPATSDAFLYQVCDNHGACDLGLVTITIGDGLDNHLPIVVDDALQTTQFGTATTLIGDLNNPGSVLDNDSDPDVGDGLTALSVSGLLNASGDLTFSPDGTFTYHNTDPAATSDSFLYEACDPHGACKAGIVTITIGNQPPDLIPIAMADAIMVGPNGTSKDLVGDANVVDSLLDNDTDAGDTLKAYLISAATNGDITINTDGTFTYTNTNAGPGVDSFEYEACDSFGACVAATVSVTIDPSAPTVICVLPAQLNEVGDTVNLDLSLLFAPPAGKSLSYSVINPAPPLSIMGSLLSGTLDTSGIFMSTLKATTVPGGVSTSEDVQFTVLPAGDILLRNGFEDPSASQVCQ